MLEELISQNRIRRNLAHHDEAQAINTTFETKLLHHVNDALSLLDRAYERDHDLYVIKTHVFTNAFHCRTFHSESLAKVGRNIT